LLSYFASPESTACDWFPAAVIAEPMFSAPLANAARLLVDSERAAFWPFANAVRIWPMPLSSTAWSLAPFGTAGAPVAFSLCTRVSVDTTTRPR
jgi:hypothetical protein